MEKFFCKIKKVSIVILLVLLIVVCITPVVQAAEIIVGKSYKYNGTGLVIFTTEKNARFMNVFDKGKKWLYPGSIINVLNKNGNAVKIAENQYININGLNKNKFELLSKELEKIKVKTIQLEQNAVTLKIGDNSGDDRKQLKATIVPDNATNKNIIWESLNPDIATVDGNGLVIGIKKGTAIIKVKSADGGTESNCTVEVKQKATGVTLNMNKATMTIGDGKKINLVATVAPDDATNKNVNWTSSNTAIATVNDEGVVTAIGTKSGENESEVTITATTKNGLASASCKVKVKYIPVTSLEGIPDKIEIIKNQDATKVLNTTIKPSNASNKEIKWKSDKESVVTVKNGTIKAVGPGTTKVTASIETRNSKGKKITISKTCEVTVKIAATGIKINITNKNIKLYETMKYDMDKAKIVYENNTFTIKPTIEPSNATNKNVIWDSDNKAVATVKDGMVTVLAEGTANIIATTANGRYSVKCKLTVEDDPYKLKVGGNIYTLSVKKNKLLSVVKTIKDKQIYQAKNHWYGGTKGRCFRIALAHLDMLRSDDVEQNIKHSSTNNGSYSNYYQNIGTTGKDVKVNFSVIKEYISGTNNRKRTPVSFHTYSDSGSQHWVALVGYKGACDGMEDLLFISCWNGKICVNNTYDVWGQHSDKEIRVLK